MEKYKRKRVVITVVQLKATKGLYAFESVAVVAKWYGVAEVTMEDWKINPKNIEQWSKCQFVSRESQWSE